MLRLDINIVWTILNLLIIFAIVKIFLIKPIHKILDERQAQADSMLTDAVKAKEEAEALVEEHKPHRTVPRNLKLSTRHP